MKDTTPTQFTPPSIFTLVYNVPSYVGDFGASACALIGPCGIG